MLLQILPIKYLACTRKIRRAYIAVGIDFTRQPEWLVILDHLKKGVIVDSASNMQIGKAAAMDLRFHLEGIGQMGYPHRSGNATLVLHARADDIRSPADDKVGGIVMAAERRLRRQ